MTTKIIIPNESYANSFSIMSEDDDTTRRGISSAYLALFEGTSYERSSFFITNGRASAEGFQSYESQQDRVDFETESDAPRVLESLGAVLVDNLSSEDEAKLQDRAEVYENFDIGLIEPDSQEDVSGDDNWHLDKLWGKAERNYTGKSVRIGIMDTGIDSTHPEFTGKHISFMEFDRSGFAKSTIARDAGDHGTHVAGIAAGKTCGVAPGADLAVAAVLTTRTPAGMSGTLAQILAGYNWLLHANHAPSPSAPISLCDVINASLGGRGFHPYLYSSVKTVLRLNRCLLVAAIGNNGRRGADNHGSPGNYDIVVGVGATDPRDIVTPFSDWGQERTSGAFKPDLSAPGAGIISAIPGGGFARMWGTSMAAPMVAGAAALLIEKYPLRNYRRNPMNLRNYLETRISTTTNGHPRNNSNPPAYSRIGSGRLDLTNL